MLIGLAQQADKLVFTRMPERKTFPRGEGAPARGRMRNGDLFRCCIHFVKKVHWERLYRLIGPHCEWKGVAIPHPPLRGPPSPRRKVWRGPHPYKFQFFAQLRKAHKHIIISCRRVLRSHTIWTAPPFSEIPASHTAQWPAHWWMPPPASSGLPPPGT